MVLYTDTYCEIVHCKALNQLCLKWRHAPDDAEVQWVYRQLMLLAKSTKVASLVIDSRLGFAVSLSMQRRIISATLSLIDQSVLQKIARVGPMDVFQEMITYRVADQLNEAVQGSIEASFFHCLEDAKVWAASPAAYSSTKKAMRPANQALVYDNSCRSKSLPRP